MSTKTNQSKAKMTQPKQESPFDQFEEEETPYYVWTELLKSDETDEEGKAIEYFDDSFLEEGSPEARTSKEDPSATYSTVPVTARYLTAIGEVTGIFYFEIPEKVYPYGVSALPNKGKISYSVMTRFSKTNPVDIRFTEVFMGGLYGHFARVTHEQGLHYIAGGDEEFDIERPSKFLRSCIRYPKDSKSKKPMTDKDKQWYIGLLNEYDNKTVFTTPFKEGEKPVPIPWAKLEKVKLTMIVTVQCASIYLGGSKVCPQFRAASAIITKPPKRGGKVINAKSAHRLAKDNPGLAANINHVLDTLEVDNPESASGFSSTVKESTGDDDEYDEDGVKVNPVKPKGKGNVEAFINSGKTRGAGASSASGKGGAGGSTGTGRGGNNGARGGTTVINRKPPPTPSKISDYQNDDGGDGESYD